MTINSLKIYKIFKEIHRHMESPVIGTDSSGNANVLSCKSSSSGMLRK